MCGIKSSSLPCRKGIFVESSGLGSRKVLAAVSGLVAEDMLKSLKLTKSKT